MLKKFILLTLLAQIIFMSDALSVEIKSSLHRCSKFIKNGSGADGSDCPPNEYCNARYLTCHVATEILCTGIAASKTCPNRSDRCTKTWAKVGVCTPR